LSGASPGRGWRAPVPVVDILRAAVAEVEDYVRVDVVSESRDLVVGSAVNDIIHLVAELVENATVFSPPNTRIEVRADRVGTGLVAEIEDRGLGLTEEERAEINDRLSTSPEFDLASSQQLGLFVVSRLANRHGIKVSLRESVYGGTTAILLMPFGVVVRAEEADSAGPPDIWFADDEPYGADARQGHQARPRRLLTSAAAITDGDQEWQLPPPEAVEPWQQTTLSLPPGSSRAGLAPWDLEAVTPWPSAWEPPARSASPGPTAPVSGSGSHLGMPIRVPQASLAQQLRSANPAEPTATREVTVRPPEANRDLMNLMQQGWARGRVDDLDDAEGAPVAEMIESEAANDTD
jgi:Histidine kinase-, DNA gyrase B-, and HSP90-like ATPase